MESTYAIVMHCDGEILVEGEFDASEVEDLIREHAPAPLADRPGTVLVRAVLEGGKVEHEGWALGLRKLT